MVEPDRAAVAYAQQFRERLEERDDVVLSGPPDREVLHRPGQLLVPLADRDRVAKELRSVLRELGRTRAPLDGAPARTPSAAARPDPRAGRAEALRRRVFEKASGTAVLTWPDRADRSNVPAVLELLRRPERWDGRPPAVLPHLVFTGVGNVMGHPARPPRAAEEPVQDGSRARGGAVTIGVCDTGIWEHAAAEHAEWLGTFHQDAQDVDTLLRPGGDGLDLQAGHGTFVAGVLLQAAPASRFDPERALDPMGVGDLVSVVVALHRLAPGAALVNLSLGCYTEDDRAPAPLARALAGLGRDVVVVAAAGNFGEDRPTWPAACKRVIAVAAVEQDDGGAYRPAPYSNSGPWVDACAVGLRTSTYVKDGDEWHGWAAWEGTSFAAPHVAGVIADDVRAGEGGNAWPAARRLLDQDPWHPDYGVLVP